MSVQWISWVLEHAEATGSKRLVLLSLANHADSDGVCWPKIDQIAKEARLTRRSVEEAMRGLVAAGFVERQTGRGRGRPNIYRLSTETPSTETGSGVSPSPESPSPETERQENPEDRANNPEESSGAIEPSVEPSLEPSDVSRSSADPPKLTLVADEPSAEELATQRFEEHFWLIWPRRHGKRVGKAQALAEWLKLTVDQQRAAVRGAKNYAAHCEDTETYPKDAERWLRKKLWTEWQQPTEQTDRPATDWTKALPNGGALTASREELGLVGDLGST